MIRVVEPGTGLNVKYQGRCPHCNALLECDKADFEFPDRPCAVGMIKCPTPNCQGQLFFDKCKEVKK